MARDERDPYDAAEPPRRSTERMQGINSAAGGNEPINPGWRQRTSRPPGRTTRPAQPTPTSSQDFVFWLQYGGWRFVAAAVALVAVVGFAIIITSQPADSSDPLVKPTVRTGPSGGIEVQTRLPTVTAAPAIPTTPPVQTGVKFRVTGTGAEGLFLRPGPNRDQPPITTLVEGSEVTIIGEDDPATGQWKHVRDAAGNTGWAFGEFLKQVP